MIFSRAAWYLIIAAALSGCDSGDPGPAPAPAALTPDRLQAATFRGVLDTPVTLVDGRFEGEPFMPDSASRPVVTLVPDVMASGDLTGDGNDETVVMLAHNAGGSGVSIYLAVLQGTRRGPENIATVRLGDRVKVLDLEISDGKLASQLVEHGPKDPMCCPTVKVRREWLLADDELVEVQQVTQPRAGRVRGHLVWGHESRSFTECDSRREGWVINDSGGELVEVYEELTSAPYQPMFVEVRGEWEEAPTEGFGADYGEALRITGFLRAENEGFGCRLDLAKVLFVASGNEPFWRLQIREDGIFMRSMGSQDERAYPAPIRRGQTERVTFESDGGDSRITILLDKRRCTDSMSGARYSWAATVAVDGQQYEGCAAEGI
jgi:uncharacterized membrane protein